MVKISTRSPWFFQTGEQAFFFINYLNQSINQPLISPEISTINELFTSSSAYFVPDRLNLIFRLYKVYRDLTSTKELFDDFYYWGGMLVSDFDQIDKYLVNAPDIFTNITELKEIDERFNLLQPENREVVQNFWKSVLIEKQSPNQEEFVRLWKDLAGIYQHYKAALHAEGIAYEGMVYRSVIEGIKEEITNPVSFFKGKKYVFVGFNALNKCEEELFNYLLKSGQASFYWDYDLYYLKDHQQEAGLFMRKNLEKFPQTEFSLSFNSFTREKKSVKILSVSSQVGQAQAAGEEISRLLKDNENLSFDNTAVVLCDEELLLPVISALPDEAQKVNITMGFPMKMTAVYSLINHLTRLQKNVKKEPEAVSFYYKNVLAILNNQLVLSICPGDCKNLSASIKTNNLIYLGKNELSGNTIFQLIFALPETLTALSDYFLEIIKYIFVYWKKKYRE